MKKLVALFLTAVMLLSMTACGDSAEPAETIPAVDKAVETATPTQPTADELTEELTEEPTAVPTEDPNAYTAYTLGADESYVDVVWDRGFYEVDMNACVEEAEFYGATGGQAIPLSLELSQNGFRMEVDYTGFDYVTSQIIPYGTVELIGMKAEGPADISGINPDEYRYADNSDFVDLNGVVSDFGSFADGYLLNDIYCYYNIDPKGSLSDLVYVIASYYVTTGNLYNTVYRVPNGVNDRGEPFLLAHIDSQNYSSPFYPEVQTLTYGDFTFEMSQFAIQCGGDRYIYDYRPGMSLSDWACSELNTDGWFPWYVDTVLSPDRKYIASTGYLSMDECFGEGAVLKAEEFDGKLDHTHDIEYSDEEMKSEEMEVSTRGNINIIVAHMVNARTPLCTPGFRILGKQDGRAAYHSVEIANVGYMQDDILDIYMNGIADELIPHIKLYAFPESEEFMDSLGESLVFNIHPTPLERGNPMLTIPEDAVCLTFQRVPDGKEAPGNANPYRPGHENLNKDAVFARYVTKDDPNFGEDVNLVFAITFDDELVYWIHMGSNFYKPGDIIVNGGGMGY